MSDYALIGSIRRSLIAIADHYDVALIPPKMTSGVKLPTQAAPEAKMKYAKPAMEHSPAPVNVDVLDARRDAHADLLHYTRVVQFEVHGIDGQTIRTRVDGDSIYELCTFLTTWAERLADEVPAEAEACAYDLAKHATKLQRFALPDRRSRQRLGECPVTVADADGNSVVCGTAVYAYPDEDGIHRFVRCPGCGTEDTIDWWMSQIVPEGADLAHATAVIACVAMRLGMALTHGQIRQWAYLGFILRHGHDDKGRTLYSTAAVLAYAQHQTKEEAA
ncbi:MAG: hypothetical protein ACXVXN_00660 [Mycobacteriaceae bacterium]